MRRDYFTCVFLLCICAALFFVCFEPLYYTYGLIVPREFSTAETVFSWVYTGAVFVVIPLYSAFRKRAWMAIGLASYGLLACLPTWILPGLADKVSGNDAGILDVGLNFILRCIYAMVNAPFASLSEPLGDDTASKLSLRILPVILIVYAVFQIFRFYRDAYLAERLDPTYGTDNAQAQSDPRKVRDAHIPDILGTVISAPVKAAPGPSAVKAAPAPSAEAKPSAAPQPQADPQRPPQPAVSSPDAGRQKLQRKPQAQRSYIESQKQKLEAEKAAENGDRPVRPRRRKIDRPVDTPEVIELPPPKVPPKEDVPGTGSDEPEQVIQLPPPKTPVSGKDKGSFSESAPEVIELPPPKSPPGTPPQM